MHDKIARVRLDSVLGRHAPLLAYILSGGAAKGFCHLGMIEALAREGVRPDLVVGTSAGALVGALYCHFGNIEEACTRIEEVLASDEFAAFQKKYFGENRRTGELVQGRVKSFFSGLAGTVKTGMQLGKALVKTSLVAQKDALSLFARIFEGITFSTLKIPFAAVAVDLATGTPSIFAVEGNGLAPGVARTLPGPEGLMKAVMASSAIPLIFPAVEIDGHPHADGYIMANLPVRQARALLAGREVFYAGFDVSSPVGQKEEDLSTVELALRLLDLATRSRQAADSELLDVLFRPVDKEYPWSSFTEYRKYLDIGAAHMSAERCAAMIDSFSARCLANVRRDGSFSRKIRAAGRLRKVLGRTAPA
jgi:NTE family protein